MKLRAIAMWMATLLFAVGAADAGEDIEEARSAAADANISIENLAGSVIVEGWDRKEVEVKGTLADDAEGLEFSGSGDHLRIEVEFPDRSWDTRDTESHLTVRVPHGSRVRVGCVNASVEASKVTGTLDLHTVNGRIAVSGNPEFVRAQTVNGEVHIDAETPEAQAESVSGEILIEGAKGDISARSVSGDIDVVAGGKVASCDLRSVSGYVHFEGDPDRNARLNLESHSGSVTLRLPRDLSAEFDVSTFSGSIRNEISDDRPERRSRYGPGKDLQFTVGSGDARITVDSFSGSVRLEVN